MNSIIGGEPSNNIQGFDFCRYFHLLHEPRANVRVKLGYKNLLHAVDYNAEQLSESIKNGNFNLQIIYVIF